MLLNKFYGIGNLGRDPELKYTQNGNPVLGLSVAIDRYKGKGQDGKPIYVTSWITVVMWGKHAEKMANQLRKGSKIFIEGELEVRTYQKQDETKGYVTEIHARNVQEINVVRQEAGYYPEGV